MQDITANDGGDCNRSHPHQVIAHTGRARPPRTRLHLWLYWTWQIRKQFVYLWCRIHHTSHTTVERHTDMSLWFCPNVSGCTVEVRAQPSGSQSQNLSLRFNLCWSSTFTQSLLIPIKIRQPTPCDIHLVAHDNNDDCHHEIGSEPLTSNQTVVTVLMEMKYVVWKTTTTNTTTADPLASHRYYHHGRPHIAMQGNITKQSLIGRMKENSFWRRLAARGHTTLRGWLLTDRQSRWTDRQLSSLTRDLLILQAGLAGRRQHSSISN